MQIYEQKKGKRKKEKRRRGERGKWVLFIQNFTLIPSFSLGSELTATLSPFLRPESIS